MVPRGGAVDPIGLQPVVYFQKERVFFGVLSRRQQQQEVSTVTRV